MSKTGATIAAETIDGLTDQVYGLCGGHIQPIWDELADTDASIIDTRDERAAVHAAHAEAEVTGDRGVATIVQVDTDADALRRNRTPDVAVHENVTDWLGSTASSAVKEKIEPCRNEALREHFRGEDTDSRTESVTDTEHDVATDRHTEVFNP